MAEVVAGGSPDRTESRRPPRTSLLAVGVAATLLAVATTTAEGQTRASANPEVARTIHFLNSLPDEVGVTPPDVSVFDQPGVAVSAQQSGTSIQGGGVGGRLTISPIFDSSLTTDANAAAIIAAINAAIANIQSMYSDPITVTIRFRKVTTGLAASGTYYVPLPYSSFLSALKADAKTGDDAAAMSLLPSTATNPVIGTSTINVKSANVRAIGLNVVGLPPAGEPDGDVFLNTSLTSPGSPGSSLTYTLIPVVEHEIDEVLGLSSSLPDTSAIFPEDLFRYSANGARTFTTATGTAFFSINGVTKLAQFHQKNDGLDFGDWESNPLPPGVLPKVQDAAATPGANPALSVELTALDVIGYDRVGTARAPGDLDGDGRTEITVYRPSTGEWYTRNSSQSYSTITFGLFQWGLAGDTRIVGDFDGDGKTDLTVYRPSTGQWFIRYSSQGYSTATYGLFQWGLVGDTPLAADFDGDGKTDLTVYPPSTGQWFIRYSSQGYSTSTYGLFQWGLGGDSPLVADFDGDGKTDITVYRPSTGQWFIRYSAQGYSTSTYGLFQWGVGGDSPIVADFDGDGKTEITVYRPSTGEWLVRYSSQGYSAGSYGLFQWGLGGDSPIVADFDGDGRAEITVYRPSTGQWYIRYSSQGFSTVTYGLFQWGLAGDLPTTQ